MNIRTLAAVAAAFALATPSLFASTYEEGLRLKQQQELAAATEAFAAVAAREPGNVLAREQLAIVLGWQNRFDDSIAMWREAIALAPENPDYKVGLARVQYWKGERRDALASLDQALAIDPQNAEALKLRGDVLLAEGDAVGARSAYLQSQALAPEDAELKVRIARAVPPKLWRLDAGYTYDDYDNFRGAENSRFVQLGRRVSQAGDVLYARYDGYDNFGRIDQGITLGAYWLPHPQLLLNLEAGRTLGTADFRPDTQFQVNGEWLLAGVLQPLLGYRYFDYDNGTVTTITPGLRAQFERTIAEVRYGFTDNIDGSTTGVFAARLALPREGYAPYFAFTTGSEALPPQAKADITILGGGVVWDLSPAWGLRVDYAYEDRKDIYQHHAIGGGFNYKF